MNLLKSNNGPKTIAKSTVMTALFVTIGNLSYSQFYIELTGFSFLGIIDAYSIATTSIISTAFAGISYFFLTRFTNKYKLIYISSVVGITVFSILIPLSPDLPDGQPMPVGFLELTAPMHLFTGIAAAFIIPGVYKIKRFSRIRIKEKV